MNAARARSHRLDLVRARVRGVLHTVAHAHGWYRTPTEEKG